MISGLPTEISELKNKYKNIPVIVLTRYCQNQSHFFQKWDVNLLYIPVTKVFTHQNLHCCISFALYLFYTISLTNSIKKRKFLSPSLVYRQRYHIAILTQFYFSRNDRKCAYKSVHSDIGNGDFGIFIGSECKQCFMI